MMAIPFVTEFDFEYGRCDRLSPLIRRVICNNPGPFTYTGTGTYIIGNGNVGVIDPGPLDDAHLDAILAALEPDEKVSHIIITHTHLDHSPLAMPLKARTGAQIYSHIQAEAETFDGLRLEEGTDEGFAPDHIVAHGDRIVGDDWALECVFTPGHTSGHMCFALTQEKALFSGDHVMGWSTTVIAPPDGDMTDYMASLDVLLTRDDTVYWPTHGTCIEDPQNFVRAYIDHRRAREAQVVERLKAGDSDIRRMVETMYAEVDKRLHPAAALSVLAHMQDLTNRGLVACDGDKPGLDSSYRLN
jgi:glyoxylase-like metal-dependent hydrolase (beta-lactamase superfamily II)